MKKLLSAIFWIVIIVCIINSCSSEDTSPSGQGEQSNESAAPAAASVDEVNVVQTEYLYWQYKYAEEHDVPLIHNAKQSELSRWLEKNNADSKIETIQMETDNFSGNDRFIISDNPYAEYLYWGDTNENRPDGYGMLYKVFDDMAQLPYYIGKFKDGRFDGYGIMFSTSFMTMYDGGYLASFFASTEELSQFALDWMCYVEYEGTFKDGAESGKGNGFVNYAYSKLCEYASEHGNTNIDYSTIGYEYLIGDYYNGMMNGHGQIYYDGYLIYDGSVKDNESSGKGTTYYPGSNAICYEGSFLRGKYNGSGTKYYEDGTVEYSGKWRNGNPA